MNDEIVEEIHQIRRETYEQTKDMTPAELVAYFHNASQEVRQEMARRRADKVAARQEAVNQ